MVGAFPEITHYSIKEMYSTKTTYKNCAGNMPRRMLMMTITGQNIQSDKSTFKRVHIHTGCTFRYNAQSEGCAFERVRAYLGYVHVLIGTYTNYTHRCSKLPEQWRRDFANIHIRSQIEMLDPCRAPPQSAKENETKKEGILSAPQSAWW